MKEPKSTEPNTGTDCRTIKFEGRTYSWTGRKWVNVETFTYPPFEATNKLNGILLSRLKKEDDEVTDGRQLLDRASDAKAQTQYDRAVRLARKVLQLTPGSLGAATIICSCLRALGKPEEALKESAPYKNENYPPLITTRAAALCDLGRWKDAKIEISKVLSFEKKNDAWKYSEPFQLLKRIKTVRPDLF